MFVLRIDEKLEHFHYTVQWVLKSSLYLCLTAYLLLYIFTSIFTSSQGCLLTAPASVSHLLQRQTCLFVCFTATAHLVCRQRWEKRIEKPFTSGHLFSMLAFNEPQKIAAWKSFQSQIKAELSEHVAKLNCVTTITSGADFGQKLQWPIGLLNE